MPIRNGEYYFYGETRIAPQTLATGGSGGPGWYNTDLFYGLDWERSQDDNTTRMTHNEAGENKSYIRLNYEHYGGNNLESYFGDLAEVPMDPGSDVILLRDASGNTAALKIVAVTLGTNLAKLEVVTDGGPNDGNPPQFSNIDVDSLGRIWLPSTQPVPPVVDDDVESDEGRGGDGPVDDGVTIEYTTGIKVLEDVMPESPLVYDGNDLIITLDLKNIIYKPSALAEIISPAFKSY
jgi:hypothetical protein